MPLAVGARIGPYEVLSALGAGGMGEVYRAHDSRLSRDVAIKVLPPDVVHDQDRLRRFEQEARAAGALNHPNLLTVFDVGQHDGSPYLVSELLEGAPLRTLLSQGPLPLRRALDLGVQIGRGLAAAHEKGIVHRDLKPENLFVTTDGRAKILDFGLAKLKLALEPVGSSAPTETSPSAPGTVLGTVGYMSPEQVRAGPVDARSDIFALGAVLFEMLSGRRAFRGDSSVETMNAILKEDPPPISDPGRPLPPALERIVLRCLEKDPHSRIQSAQDLAIALEALSGDSRTSTPQGVALPSASRTARRAWIAALTTASLVVPLAAFWAGRRSADHPAPVFERLTHRQGRVGEARFAPDGQTILYSAEWEARPSQVFSARAGSLESRPLDLPDAALLAVSSSGEMAVSLRPEYRAPRDSMLGTLARVPLAGGAPREVLDGVFGADWSPDGSEMAVVKSGPKSRLEFPLGTLALESDEPLAHPRVSPRGDRVALFEWKGWPCAVVLVDRKGVKRALTGHDYRLCNGLAWSTDGREVWFTANDAGGTTNLRAVTLEGRERVVHANPGTLSLRDISPRGDVLLARATSRFSIHGRVPGAEAERNLSWFANSYAMDLSVDGTTLILGDWSSAAGVQPIFLRRTDGSPAVRLGDGWGGRLSPDGKWAAAFASRPERIILLPTGAGQPRDLPVGDFVVAGVAWFPDGRKILAYGRKGGSLGPWVTWTQDLEGGPAVPILKEGYIGWHVSPDGRSVLAQTKEDGPFALCAIDGGPCRTLSSLDPQVDQPERFSPDGRSLVLGSLPTPMAIVLARLDLATGRRETLKTLTPIDLTGVFAFGYYTITPDGRYYVYSVGQVLSDLYLVKGLR